MYLPDELWIIVKYFLFHNIKFSKHLKKDKEIITFNKVIKSLPRRLAPRYGPRIMYFPKKKIYKNFYLLRIKNNNFFKIIVVINLPEDYKEKFQIYDKLIRIDYYLDL